MPLLRCRSGHSVAAAWGGRVGTPRYYAVSIERLIELMTAAGFTGVERVDRAFFQPLIVGTRSVT